MDTDNSAKSLKFVIFNRIRIIIKNIAITILQASPADIKVD